MGDQTNRGLNNGCVARRTFDPQHAAVLEKVHALARSVVDIDMKSIVWHACPPFVYEQVFACPCHQRDAPKVSSQVLEVEVKVCCQTQWVEC